MGEKSTSQSDTAGSASAAEDKRIGAGASEFSNGLKEAVEVYSTADDFTFFLTVGDANLEAFFAKQAGVVQDSTSARKDHQFDFQHVHANDRFRIVACRTNRATAWSISARRLTKAHGKPAQMADKQASTALKSWYADKPTYLLNEQPYLLNEQLQEKYDKLDQLSKVPLFAAKEVVDVVYDAFTSSWRNPKGLLLIGGETGSLKSQVSTGLSARHLIGLINSRSKYIHLLTHEDPIEKPIFADDYFKNFSDYAHCPLRYTPRQLRLDTASVRETTEAALRQKPALLFVGEVRHEEDLKACLEFAGTGHFVVATHHSGSLLESIEKVFSSVRARDAGDRAVWAQKLFGVVHLRRLSCTLPVKYRETSPSENRPAGDSPSGIVPSVFRATPQGVRGLVADGLMSILPHYPTTVDPPCGSLGRKYFVRKLCDMKIEDESIKDKELKEILSEIRTWNGGSDRDSQAADLSGGRRLIDVAFEEDLNGR